MEIAKAHAYRGETDAAFLWLDRAYRAHESELGWVRFDPILRGLHGDRRFHQLLVRMKLEDADGGASR